MQPDHRLLDDLTETSTRVEPARVVGDPDAETWDAACDVLVVGVGLAGVCAALRSAEDKSLEVIASIAARAAGRAGFRRRRLHGRRYSRPEGSRCRGYAGEHGELPLLRDRQHRALGHRAPLCRGERSFPGLAGKVRRPLRRSGDGRKDLLSRDRLALFLGQRADRPRPRAGNAGTAWPPGQAGQGRRADQAFGHYLLPPLLASMQAQANVRFFPQTRATRLWRTGTAPSSASKCCASHRVSRPGGMR